MLLLLDEFGKTLFELSETTRDCAHWTSQKHAGTSIQTLPPKSLHKHHRL